MKGQLNFQDLMMVSYNCLASSQPNFCISFSGYDIIDLFLSLQAFCALFFATFSFAQANVQFPDIGKARESAKKVFSIIDSKPSIDVYSPVSPESSQLYCK